MILISHEFVSWFLGFGFIYSNDEETMADISFFFPINFFINLSETGVLQFCRIFDSTSY